MHTKKSYYDEREKHRVRVIMGLFFREENLTFVLLAKNNLPLKLCYNLIVLLNNRKQVS